MHAASLLADLTRPYRLIHHGRRRVTWNEKARLAQGESRLKVDLPRTSILYQR